MRDQASQAERRKKEEEKKMVAMHSDGYAQVLPTHKMWCVLQLPF